MITLGLPASIVGKLGKPVAMGPKIGKARSIVHVLDTTLGISYSVLGLQQHNIVGLIHDWK